MDPQGLEVRLSKQTLIEAIKMNIGVVNFTMKMTFNQVEWIGKIRIADPKIIG